MKNELVNPFKTDIWSFLTPLSLLASLIFLFIWFGFRYGMEQVDVIAIVFLVLALLNFLATMIFGIIGSVKTDSKKRIANIIISAAALVGTIVSSFWATTIASLIISFGRAVNLDNKRMDEQYGSVQRYLDHFDKTELNLISTNKYHDNKNKCFDETGEFYNLLYNADNNEIKMTASSFDTSDFNSFSYQVPYNDFSYLILRSDGVAQIYVAPDLNQSFVKYFQFDQETTNYIIQRANEVLAEYYNSSVSSS